MRKEKDLKVLRKERILSDAFLTGLKLSLRSTRLTTEWKVVTIKSRDEVVIGC